MWGLKARQEVKVVGEKGTDVEVDVVSPLGAAENANQDLVEFPARAKQEATVESTAGQLEDCTTRGNVEQRACHSVSIDAMAGDDLSRKLWHL